MRVSADDVVYAMGKEPVGQVALALVGQQHILVAPVWHTDDDVGIHRLGLGDIAGDDRGVDEVDDTWCRHADAVGAVSVVEQADADAVVLDDERVECLALGGIAVGAKVLHAQRVHHLYGAVDAPRIGVHTVVVAGGEHVEATVDGRFQVLVGSTELRVAFIGRSSERHLEVGYGDVGTLYLRGHIVEHVAVVVGAIGCAGGLDLWLVLHQVASKDEGHLMLLGLGGNGAFGTALGIARAA